MAARATGLGQHWLICVLLAAGLMPGVLAQIAYRPPVIHVDTLKYLYGRYPGSEPLTYRCPSRSISPSIASELGSRRRADQRISPGRMTLDKVSGARNLRAFGCAEDGRLFRGARGGPLSESLYGRIWH